MTRDGVTALGVDSRGRDTAALVSLHIPTGELTILAEDERADVEQILTDPVTGELWPTSSSTPRWSGSRSPRRWQADIETLS